MDNDVEKEDVTQNSSYENNQYSVDNFVSLLLCFFNGANSF